MRSVAITKDPCWSGGQGKAENRSAAGIGFTFQPTTMRLDDRAANRQAETHAVRFCRDERLEEVIGYCFGNAWPAVENRDLDGLIVEQCRPYLEFAPSIPGHRLDRVAHQIDEDLLDLHPVGK